MSGDALDEITGWECWLRITIGTQGWELQIPGEVLRLCLRKGREGRMYQVPFSAIAIYAIPTNHPDISLFHIITRSASPLTMQRSVSHSLSPSHAPPSLPLPSSVGTGQGSDTASGRCGELSPPSECFQGTGRGWFDSVGRLVDVEVKCLQEILGTVVH